MTPRRLILTSLISAWVTALAAPRAAMADLLSSYNVYVLNDLTLGSDTLQGNVAVGGDATLDQVAIGAKVAASATNLVIAGNLTANGGSVNGQTVVGGTVAASGGWTTTALQPPGTPSPINFTADSARLINLSAQIGALPERGSISVSGPTMTLTGVGSGIDVFNISSLSGITSIRVAASVNETVMINLAGTAGSLTFVGLSLGGGVTETNVLWNFPDATTLNIEGVGLLGSVLAPNANFTGFAGVILGDLIVNDFDPPCCDGDEVDYFPFAGQLPPAQTTDTPEPASLTLLAFGLGALALSRRTRGRDPASDRRTPSLGSTPPVAARAAPAPDPRRPAQGIPDAALSWP